MASGQGTPARRGTRPAAGNGRAKRVVAGPSLREERRLLRSGHQWLAAVDEVGRGALAGPVTVGVVVVDAATRSAPSGVRDSKLLTPAARQALAPRLRRWAPAHAVGHAEPEEIDRVGIIAALRLAAWRAFAQLPVRPTCVLLDGSHDWLTPPAAPGPATATLFDLPECPAPPEDAATVVTRVKADMRCAAVAAASVLAKVERDALMVARAADHPQYGWQDNKGYSAPEHIAALRAHGPSVQHRRSWCLPGVGGEEEGGLPAEALLDDSLLDEALLDEALLDEALLDEALHDDALDGPGEGDTPGPGTFGGAPPDVDLRRPSLFGAVVPGGAAGEPVGH